MSTNPLLKDFTTPYESVPFEKIELEHYMPAFKESIEKARKEIDVIANSNENPDFKNTIEALEYSGHQLDRVGSVFFNLNHAHTNDEMQALARDISPMLTEFSNDIIMNENLFLRVKSVYENKSNFNLNVEQERLLMDRYK